ncbi:MAG: ABC transporter substrate-binding protein [Sarcina sp.]
MKKKFICLCTAILLTTSFVSCGQGKTQTTTTTNTATTEQVSSKTQYPVTIQNFNYDRKMVDSTYQKAPERVITSVATATEIMIRLGLSDRIVAALETTDIPDDIKDEYSKLKLLNFKELKNKEIAMTYEPDMIFGWWDDFNPHLLNKTEDWNANGVNTFIQANSGASSYRVFDNMYNDILDIGKIFDVEDKSEKLVNDMKKRVHNIQVKAKEIESKPKVLVAEHTSKGTLRLYGKGSIPHEMIERLGAIDVAEGVATDYTSEHLIKANPDVIIVPHLTSQDPKEMVDKLLNDPALANVTAIKNKRVHSITRSEIYGSCPRTIDGFENFAKFIYPNEFK